MIDIILKYSLNNDFAVPAVTIMQLLYVFISCIEFSEESTCFSQSSIFFVFFAGFISMFITYLLSSVVFIIGYNYFNIVNDNSLTYTLIIFFVINIIYSVTLMFKNKDIVTYFGILETLTRLNNILINKKENTKKWNKEYDNVKKINKYLNIDNV